MSYADTTHNDVAIRPVSRLLSGLLDRLRPTVYIDGRDVPNPPESPYRARLTLPPEQRTDDVDPARNAKSYGAK